MNLEQIWSLEQLPEKAQVTIHNFAAIDGGKLLFQSNEKVIGEYDYKDPDGGRSIHGAATVELDDFIIEFSYREKWWEGLRVLVKKKGEKYLSEAPFDEDFPNWAFQED